MESGSIWSLVVQKRKKSTLNNWWQKWNCLRLQETPKCSQCKGKEHRLSEGENLLQGDLLPSRQRPLKCPELLLGHPRCERLKGELLLWMPRLLLGRPLPDGKSQEGGTTLKRAQILILGLTGSQKPQEEDRARFIKKEEDG